MMASGGSNEAASLVACTTEQPCQNASATLDHLMVFAIPPELLNADEPNPLIPHPFELVSKQNCKCWVFLLVEQSGEFQVMGNNIPILLSDWVVNSLPMN